jgi:hypothetical protein
LRHAASLTRNSVFTFAKFRHKDYIGFSLERKPVRPFSGHFLNFFRVSPPSLEIVAANLDLFLFGRKLKATP